MPITLEKILSPTAETSFEFMDETVHVTFAPLRYTGQMQEMAERLSDDEKAEQDEIRALREQADELLASATPEDKEAAESKAAGLRADAASREQRLDLRDRRAVRDALATDGDAKGGPPGMLVAWDVMEGRKALPTDRATLDRLPDIFLRLVFLSLARENMPDPPKAPTSDEP